MRQKIVIACDSFKGCLESGDVASAVAEGICRVMPDTEVARDINSADQAKDGFMIRRLAVENNVTVFTATDTVSVLLDVLEELTMPVSTIDA